jgi:peroxin-12
MEFIPALRSSLDERRPSLFDLLYEQSLADLLPPTLRYLLTVATQRHPRYLLRALNSFDELHALVMLLVERHYLRTRAASFTEHFYGLKRERALPFPVPRAAVAAPGPVRDALALSSADVWKNLAVLVGVPYLRRKLRDHHDADAPRALMGTAYTQMPPNPTARQRLLHYYRWFLRNVYPSVHAAYAFAVLAWNLAYLFDGTQFHHPLLWLVGTRIRRVGAEDHRAVEALSRPRPGKPPGPQSLFSPRNWGAKALGSLSLLLPASIFALKFLEWWHASDFAKQLSRRAAEGLDLPPPIVTGLPDGALRGILKKEGAASSASSPPGSPQKRTAATTSEQAQGQDPLAENAPIAKPSLLPILTVTAPADSSLCPICGEEIQTATACQTGVVYCYACIHRWVAGQHARQESFMADKMGKWESGIGRCAVTGRRVLGGTEGLRRIMV